MEEVKKERGQSRGRKKGSQSWLPALAGAAVVLLVGGTGFYIYSAQAYRTVYFPNTTINGLDVSGRSVSEAEEMISASVDSYKLELVTRTGQEAIAGEAIGLHTAFNGGMEELLKAQNPYQWIFPTAPDHEYTVETMIAYDEEKLEQAVENLKCMDASSAVSPEDAHLSDYIPGTGYEIVPETEGTVLDEGMVMEAIVRGVENLTPSLNLDELGCYEKPAVTSQEGALIRERDARNRYVNLTVTYTFGEQTQILDDSQICQWLSWDGENIQVDETAVADFVSGLAKEHNTAYTTRNFVTSYKKTVPVSGSYGWRINQSQETAELMAVLAAGESTTREPVYSQTAASHKAPDYGNSYVEVNLTAQHLFLYKDGEKILESDFVSGNVSKNYTTPPGLFGLTYKQKDAVLRGEGYASPVKFWMPFNGGIGFHDASWRSTFGGTIYKTNGSHGCVNMPYEAAKTLYENIYAGFPVICYNLEGTESKQTTNASGKPQGGSGTTAAPAQTAPSAAETAAATPAETQPAETPAPETQPAQVQPVTEPAASQPEPETTAAGPGGKGPGVSQTEGSSASVGPGVTQPESESASGGPGVSQTSAVVQPVS